MVHADQGAEERVAGAYENHVRKYILCCQPCTGQAENFLCNFPGNRVYYMHDYFPGGSIAPLDYGYKGGVTMKLVIIRPGGSVRGPAL